MSTKSAPAASKPEVSTPPKSKTVPAAAKTAITPPVAAKKRSAAVRQPKPAAPQVAPAQAPAAVAAVPPGKAGKKPAKSRPVLVRDSFTMPEADFALLAQLKSVALGARRAAKKSELLRAGLHVLAKMDGKSLVAVLDGLETVKTGRPKKGH